MFNLFFTILPYINYKRWRLQHSSMVRGRTQFPINLDGVHRRTFPWGYSSNKNRQMAYHGRTCMGGQWLDVAPFLMIFNFRLKFLMIPPKKTVTSFCHLNYIG